MANQKYEPVFFYNSQGEKITNDPVLKAQQTLAAAGVDVNQSPALKSEEEMPQDEKDQYDDLSGAELKELAKERGIDISGLKKVSEVRARFREVDAQEAAEANGGDNNSDDE